MGRRWAVLYRCPSQVSRCLLPVSVSHSHRNLQAGAYLGDNREKKQTRALSWAPGLQHGHSRNWSLGLLRLPSPLLLHQPSCFDSPGLCSSGWMQNGLVSSQNHADVWLGRWGEFMVISFSSLESGLTELQNKQHWAEITYECVLWGEPCSKRKRNKNIKRKQLFITM